MYTISGRRFLPFADDRLVPRASLLHWPTRHVTASENATFMSIIISILSPSIHPKHIRSIPKYTLWQKHAEDKIPVILQGRLTAEGDTIYQIDSIRDTNHIIAINLSSTTPFYPIILRNYLSLKMNNDYSSLYTSDIQNQVAMAPLVQPPWPQPHGLVHPKYHTLFLVILPVLRKTPIERS